MKWQITITINVITKTNAILYSKKRIISFYKLNANITTLIKYQNTEGLSRLVFSKFNHKTHKITFTMLKTLYSRKDDWLIDYFTKRATTAFYSPVHVKRKWLIVIFRAWTNCSIWTNLLSEQIFIFERIVYVKESFCCNEIQ